MRFRALTVFCLCASPLVGCGGGPIGGPVGEATISGQVTDRATNGPVAGATIGIRGADNPSTQSNAQGAYSIRVTWEEYQQSEGGILVLGMLVIKSGYAPVDTTFAVLPPRTTLTIDVAMSPSPTIR